MKRDALYIHHILEAVQKIETHTAAGREAFMAGSHWQDATIRQFEIIGATQQLSRELRAQYGDVP